MSFVSNCVTPNIQTWTPALMEPVYFSDHCPIKPPEAFVLPKFLANYAKMGHVYTVDGSALCKYCDDVVPSQEFCEKVVAKLKQVFHETGQLSQIESLPLSDIYGNGYPIQIEDRKGYIHKSKCLTFRMRVHPNEKQNIVDALDFANSGIQHVFSNEESLESFLIDLNYRLTKGMEDKALNSKGYRERKVNVLRDNPNPLTESKESFRYRVVQQIAHLLGAKKFEKFRNEKFTSSELREVNIALAGLVYIPPYPKDISHEMKRFIEGLFVQLKESEKSPHEIASWAHTRYVQIHPHNDCNGKGARILFNMVLAYFGQQSLVFPSDEEYTLAVENELTKRGSFLQYVVEKVIPWNEKNYPHFKELS